MKKIKVVHYLRHLGLGGTEKTCQLFFGHASEDFDVHLIFEKTGDHTRLPEFLKSAKMSGGTIHRVDSYKRGFDDPDPYHLQEVIESIDPDIFHVYRSGFAEYPRPGQDIHVPNFVETNVFGMLDPSPEITKSLFMSHWLMDRAMSHPYMLTGDMFRMDRFNFVNNPVEDVYTDKVLKWKNSLPSTAIVLGRCGRPDNGIYNAVSVNAAANLRSQGYDIHFLVVAPPSNMLDDLARLGIPFYAVDPTVDPLVLSTVYNSMDIYAHARADGETFGVNIAEAMMHSLPVVTHIATPSNPQMGVFQSQAELVDDFYTGYVVPNDVNAYTAALLKLVKSKELRLEMGEKGREKALDNYHVSACMQKLEHIYREIVNG